MSTNYYHSLQRKLAAQEETTFTTQPSLIDPVRDIIESVIESDYTSLLEKRGQTYQIRVGKAGLLIWADRVLLLQVYDNLISNAIKYGEPGGKIIFSIIERGAMDELSVWNSGHGISSGDLEHIFEHSARRSEDNTISLALTRMIIEKHRGRLWVESKPGAWANFIFTLPKRGMMGREEGK